MLNFYVVPAFTYCRLIQSWNLFWKALITMLAKATECRAQPYRESERAIPAETQEIVWIHSGFALSFAVVELYKLPLRPPYVT